MKVLGVTPCLFVVGVVALELPISDEKAFPKNPPIPKPPVAAPDGVDVLLLWWLLLLTLLVC